MSSVKISRGSEFTDRLRAYEVILDGQKIGELRSGETREFPISQGQHRMRLKIDWGGSESVEFTTTDERLLEFSARSGLAVDGSTYSILKSVLFNRNSYLVLEPAGSPGSPVDTVDPLKQAMQESNPWIGILTSVVLILGGIFFVLLQHKIGWVIIGIGALTLLFRLALAVIKRYYIR